MRIPKSFQLVNRRWTVKIVSDDEMNEVMRREDENHKGPAPLGLCSNPSATIYLNKDAHADKPREWLEHTFCHEVMHALQYANGQHAEDHDEVFTDRWGGFLHQFFTTQKGEHA